MRIRKQRIGRTSKVWKAEAQVRADYMKEIAADNLPAVLPPTYVPEFKPVQRDRLYEDGVYVDVSGRGPGLHTIAVVCVKGDQMAVVTTAATDTLNTMRAEREAIRLARTLHGGTVYCDNQDACRMEDATYVQNHNNLAAHNAARKATNFKPRDQLPPIYQLGLDKEL